MFPQSEQVVEDGQSPPAASPWATHHAGRGRSFLGHDRLRFALFGVPEFAKVALGAGGRVKAGRDLCRGMK